MPRRRDVRGTGKGGERQGSGLGGGPVGPGSYSGRTGQNRQNSQNSNSQSYQGNETPDRSITGNDTADKALVIGLLALLFRSKKEMTTKQRIIRIILFGVMVFLVLYGFRACMSSGVEEDYSAEPYVSTSVEQSYEKPAYEEPANEEPVQQTTAGNPYGIETINAGTTSTVTSATNGNSSSVNTTEADGIRSRYYQADKNTTVNVMIYMIGTDLESQYGMATNDLVEIVNGTETIPDNVNIIVYGGGCKKWNNQVFSNSTNLIYQIQPGGQFEKLKDCGNEVMTDPDTLAGFIQFVKKNYPTDTPTNRNILILWDHGGGSISGYGYDERHKSSGSMDLGEISDALEAGGIRYDFVGFDACLMATTETAYTIAPWADYLIGSEEAEPGIGWYYTRWMNTLCSNPTVSTLDLSKIIIDDFVDVCAQKCQGQDTTLSVVDLAEFQSVIPKELASFASSTIELIKTDYTKVAQARSSAREFSPTSKLDQVDVVSLAKKINTEESNEFADALRSTIKYNRTSKSMTNAYGLSIYFPYRNTSYLNEAIDTYSDIGIEGSYSDCIRTYASLSSAGQYSSASSSSPMDALFGSGYSSGTTVSSEDVYTLLNGLLSGYYGYGRSIPLDVQSATEFVTTNQFDTGLLVWTKNADGLYTMHFPKSQWELITRVEQNLFLYDGSGYIDYGCDLTQDCLTESGDLIGDFYGAWLSINGYECAYYRENEVTDQDGNVTVTGRVPCLYNGQRGYLVVQHDNDKGSIVGVCLNYQKDDIDVSPKTIPVSELQSSDTIVLIADYYNNSQEYEDTYRISDEMTWGEQGLEVYDVTLRNPQNADARYRITDIYGNQFWTPTLP